MHKHRLPNAKRADLLTPINIPPEEEGKQDSFPSPFWPDVCYFSLGSSCPLGVTDLYKILSPQHFSPSPCLCTALHLSTRRVCVYVACMPVRARWPGASISSLRLLGFIKPCDSCKAPHLLSQIIFVVGGHRQVTARVSVTLTRFPINTVWTDSTPKGCNPWTAYAKQPF